MTRDEKADAIKATVVQETLVAAAIFSRIWNAMFVNGGPVPRQPTVRDFQWFLDVLPRLAEKDIDIAYAICKEDIK